MSSRKSAGAKTVPRGMMAIVLSLCFLVIAAPASGAVYCIKTRGTSPRKPVILRDVTCYRSESDVTANVVAALGSQGPQGESCTVVANGDGTFTVSCGGGTSAVLTDPGYIPAGYTAADPIKGGAAYAKWWVTQADGPGTLAGAGVTVGAEWVRCKTCHAWDGRGNRASYANRTGQSTGTASRPDVSTVDLWPTVRATTPMQLFELIKGTGQRDLNTQGNGHPDYSAVLSDVQIWNLVKFMREGWIFPDRLYYVAVAGPPVYKDGGGTVIPPTLTYYGIGANGDATRGDAVYSAACASCHGANGTALNIAGASVGELGRTKPYELWHKAKFGSISDSSVADMQPGIVTNTGDLADLFRALTNTTTYPDIP